MSSTSSFTEAKLPERITSSVRSAKNRSTRLSHDDDEVHIEARTLGEPCLHLWMLVGRVVVGDQVQFQALGRLPVDLFEKTQPFDMRVALLGAGDQLALQIVERREQRGRAMAPIIMRHRARMTWAERQGRLRALQ